MTHASHDPPSLLRRTLAWGVHTYTALGLVAAAVIAVLIVRGTGADYRTAFLLMIAATLVDATDGMLARAVRIKETLPGFDGRKLDDLVDFLNYACLPLFLLWRMDILPDTLQAILFLPLLASAYGFCQVYAKSDDGYFLGFPSYWNIVAFYIYVLQPLPLGVTLAMLIVPAIFTFVPSHYIYPTIGSGPLNVATNVLGAVWATLLVWILFALPDQLPPWEDDWLRTLALISLFFPAFYLGASWLITLRIWKLKKRGRVSTP